MDREKLHVVYVGSNRCPTSLFVAVTTKTATTTTTATITTTGQDDESTASEALLSLTPKPDASPFLSGETFAAVIHISVRLIHYTN